MSTEIEVVHDTSHVDKAIASGQQRATHRDRMATRNARLEKAGVALAGVITGAVVTYLAMASLPMLVREITHETITAQAPSAAPPAVFTRAPQEQKTTIDGSKIVTNYVIFHDIATPAGMIETGWHYSDENQREPDKQWCQLMGLPDLDGNYKVTPVDNLRPDQKAMCTWFNGRKS